MSLTIAIIPYLRPRRTFLMDNIGHCKSIHCFIIIPNSVNDNLFFCRQAIRLNNLIFRNLIILSN